MVHGFTKGSSLPIYLVLEHLIVARSFFYHIIYYMRAIKRECIGTYRTSGKCPSYHYSVISILSESEDPFDKDKLHP